MFLLLHQESFKKYVGTIITRKNTRTDTYYRDDPSIFGWEIANEPSNPGDDSGDVLQVRNDLRHTAAQMALAQSCAAHHARDWQANVPVHTS